MRIHSLTTRFVLTLLLSTAVPFLVFAWFVRGELRDRQEHFIETLISGAAESLATRVASQLEAFQQECSLFRSVAERALAAEISIGEFTDEVEFSPSFHRDYHLVVLADAEGRVRSFVESVEQDGPTSATRNALRPRTVRDAEWFRDLLDPSGGDGAPTRGQVWLDRHLSPYMHRDTEKVSRNPADYSYGLAFVVQGKDRVLGVMLALRRWAEIQAEVDHRVEGLRPDFASAEAFMFCSSGAVLAHTDRALYRELMTGRAALEAAAQGDLGVVKYVDRGTPVHTGIRRIDGRAESLGWRCGALAADRDLFAVSRQFGNLLFLVTVVVAGILVVWAWFASRRILRPVRRLASATERIAAGDFETRVPTSGRDEISDLGRAFNTMASEVAASRDQLRSAERQAAWAEMARQVAHEIKNPLTPMRMSAQLLLRAKREEDPRLPELVDRLARTVKEQTESLARIATDFSQFAGVPVRELSAVSVEELLADVESDFAATVESGVALTFENRAADRSVRIDRREIRRVFLNLVQNALDAAGVDGEVRVTAEPGGAGVLFRVCDNGPGVDAAVQDRLFEPYFTTRSSGTGLGLAICRRVVEGHEGSIELASSEPGRTEFRFDLPLA